MIRFEQVSHRYGQRPSLQELRLRIAPGEFVFLVGPTGAGKTTLLRLVLGQEFCSSGRVEVFGRDLARLGSAELAAHRRKIGVVFQEFKLLRHRTVLENVALPLRIQGLPSAEIHRRAQTTLQLVGLEDKQDELVEHLSGGEQQRTAIARAILPAPLLLLADEPTGNLDPVTSIEILHLFLDIQARGATVVVATHDLELVRLLKQRVILLKSGRLVSDRTGISRSDLSWFQAEG